LHALPALRARIPVSASVSDDQSFLARQACKAIAFAAEHIMCGFASTIVAGGTESMSLVPMAGTSGVPIPS